MRIWTIIVLFAIAVRAQAHEGRQLYEQKCLYCHSGAATERMRLSVGGWRKLVERMRASAPLLISAREAEGIVRYLALELKLVPAAAPTRHERPVATRPRPAARVETVASEEKAHAEVVYGPEPPPELESATSAEAAPSPAPRACSCPMPTDEEPDPDDFEAEAKGPWLIADRCSKCHTLRRVFTKIDSAEFGVSVIDRMSRKSGSGITPRDAELLRRFIRLRTAAR